MKPKAPNKPKAVTGADGKAKAGRVGRRENLIPLNERTKEEQRVIVVAGGVASGEARREKKRIAEIYADVLARKFQVLDSDGEPTIGNDGKPIEMSGSQMVGEVVAKVLQRGDSASVSMIKELREGLDGSMLQVELDDVSTMTPEERKERIAQLQARLKDEK